MRPTRRCERKARKTREFSPGKKHMEFIRTNRKAVAEVCQEGKESDMGLPQSKEKTIIFVDWLIIDNIKVKARTVNSYSTFHLSHLKGQ